MQTPFFTLDANTLTLTGDWQLRNYAAIRRQLARMPASSQDVHALDARALKQLDTAGASLLADWLGAQRLQRLIQYDAAMLRCRARNALLHALVAALAAWVVGFAPPVDGG